MGKLKHRLKIWINGVKKQKMDLNLLTKKLFLGKRGVFFRRVLPGVGLASLGFTMIASFQNLATPPTLTCVSPWTLSNGVCVTTDGGYSTTFPSPVCEGNQPVNEFGYNYQENVLGNEDQCVPRQSGDGTNQPLDCSTNFVGHLFYGMYVLSGTQVVESGKDRCQFTATLAYSTAQCAPPWTLSGQWSSTNGLCVLNQTPTSSQVCGNPKAPNITVDYFSTYQDECTGSTNIITGFGLGSYIGKVTQGMTVLQATEKIQKGPDLVDLTAAPVNLLIASCQTISTPGNYLVTQNLTSANGQNCISIQNTPNVTFSCGGHTITGTGGGNAIDVSNVQNFSVTGCSLQSNAPANTLNLSKVNDGAISGNTIGNLNSNSQVLNTFNVNNAQNLSITNNTIDGTLQLNFSTNSVISYNTFTSPTTGVKGVFIGAAVLLNFGSNNQVLNNTIDGRWNGQMGDNWENGSDDGIYPGDESGDKISNNSIKNEFDTGIEFSGTNLNHIVTGNTISNAGISGIGGWYWFSLSGSNISNNFVSTAQYLFNFYRIYGLRPANFSYQGQSADTGVYFQNNTFYANTVSNLVIPNGYSPPMNTGIIALYNNMNYAFGNAGYECTDPAKSQFYLSNNTFTANNFGSNMYPIDFQNGTNPILSGDVVDGGANICTSPPRPYPLKCSP